MCGRHQEHKTCLYVVDQRIVEFETRNPFVTAHHTHIFCVLAVGDTPAVGGAGREGGLPPRAVDIVQPDGP